MVSHMVGVGEETGALDTMLTKIADFYDDEVAAAVKALTSIIEPVMIIFVGGIVGVIVISMYLPLFSIYNSIVDVARVASLGSSAIVPRDRHRRRQPRTSTALRPTPDPVLAEMEAARRARAGFRSCGPETGALLHVAGARPRREARRRGRDRDRRVDAVPRPRAPRGRHDRLVRDRRGAPRRGARTISSGRACSTERPAPAGRPRGARSARRCRSTWRSSTGSRRSTATTSSCCCRCSAPGRCWPWTTC